MAKKYRIKLKNGRLVGPFLKSQVGELYLKGHISGVEECQYFPAGDWKPLENFSELSQLIVELIAKKKNLDSLESEESETIAKIEMVRKLKEKKERENIEKEFTDSRKEQESFDEFQYSKSDESKIDYEELEKKFQDSKEDEGVDKTRIVRLSNFEQEPVDRTRIIKRNDSKEIKEETKEVVEEEEIVEEEKIDQDEKTVVANLNELLPALNQEAQLEERKLDKKERDLKKVKEAEVKDEILDDEEEDEVEEKKRKMKPIVALTIFVLVAFLLFDDGEEKKEVPIKPRAVKVLVPVPAEVLDEVKATKFFNEGRAKYQLGTYLGKVFAADLFKKSLIHKYNDNKALGYLIQTYAEIYDNALDKAAAQKTIVDLIRVAESKILTDVNIALGSAIFYYKSEKYQTSLNIIKNYLRVSQKPSLKLLSYYLFVLIDTGDLAEARNVVNRLEEVTKKPVETYLAIAKFYEVNENYNNGRKVLEGGLKEYPSSVALLLEYARYEFRDQKTKQYSNILKRIRALRAEESPVYYADFLEQMGMLSVLLGNNNQALILFKQALALNESDELRSKLAALELGGADAVEKLIAESKIVELMRRAKNEVKERNWEQAFLYAIEAADLNPNYIPAQLLLADIQVDRGYFQSALDTLKKLTEKYPTNTTVNLSLVNAYISSYRLNDAQQQISQISQTLIVKTAEYASVLARYYNKAGDSISAMKWYDVSVKRNALNADNYYQFAKTLLEYRRYKRSQARLNKAIVLDPLNDRYHSLYSKILFELEGAEVAIGYLRKFMQENNESTLLLGDIASYYYQNGQQKEFEDYKKRIEDKSSGDSSFYRFLIRSAKLNGNADEIIKYSKELIKINPGDLPTYMQLGESYFQRGKYKEAIETFEAVKLRLESYPKVNYFLARVYLAAGQVGKAFNAAKLEVEDNPRIEYGHFILGEVYKAQKNWLEAEKSLEKAITINKNYVEALSSLCWIHYRQNRLKKALRKCKRARQAAPNSPDLRKKLGYIYRGTGQLDLAWEEFDTYLKLDPGANDRRTIQQLMRQLKN